MPKAIKENPIYLIVPAIVVIVAAVFFMAHRTESASEWEKMTNPEGYGEVEIHDVVAHYHENNYYVWAVGTRNDAGIDKAVVFTFDPNNRIWLAWETEDCNSFNSIALLYDPDNAEGDNAPYRLWAAGGDNNHGCVFQSDKGIYNDWQANRDENNPLGNKHLNGIALAYNDSSDPSAGYQVWAVGNALDIFYSSDKGTDWDIQTLPPGGLNQNEIFAVDKDTVWIVGDSGKVCEKQVAGWNCSNIPTNPALTDVAFIDSDHGWASVNSTKFAYFDRAAVPQWSLIDTNLPAGSIMKSVSVIEHGADRHIWFSGEDGKIIFGKNNQGWYNQATDISGTLFGIAAVNRTHAWAVGETSVILKISPGNVAGWGWVGADNCDGVGAVCANANPAGAERQIPVGWLSFNCANNDVCDTTTFSYGVNVKRKKDGTACTDESQDKDVGALSGYAWFGMTDPNEYEPTAECERFCVGGDNDGLACLGDSDCTGTPNGSCGRCSNNPELTCNNKDDCALCSKNPESCQSIAWLSFDRTDAVNVSAGEQLPGTPYQVFPFETPCTVGRLDNLIQQGDPENDVMATLDYDTYAVEGWARFKLGQCSNDADTACFKDPDCGGGTCDYFGQGRCSNDWNIICDDNVPCGGNACDFPEGWVRLRSDISQREPNPTGPFERCHACKTIDPDDKDPEDYNGDEYIICEICENDTTGAKNTCNNCEGTTSHCGTGKCASDGNNPCIVYPENERAQKDSCYISSGGADHCVANSATDPTFTVCDECDFCDAYGVSVDMEGGKWYGRAWSEDFGWIDVSRAGLYSQAWLRAIYGDIYAKVGIGSPKMAKAPGYETSGEQCNATYLVMTGGVMYNFCTEAELIDPSQSQFRTTPSYEFPAHTGANPWLIKGYRAFEMPTGTSMYSVLGKIDYDKMESKATAATRSNKKTISNFTSGLFGVEIDLDGRTFFNNNELTIDISITFKEGADAVAVPDGIVDGSGMILVNGDLTVNHDITYNDIGVGSYKEVPSVAFYVKGDMIVGPEVDKIEGTYYVEGEFKTETSAKQLVVNGLIIAGGFDFGRTYIGQIDHPAPAELITYDGRIQINPPPGFRDLSKALPKFREVTP